MNFAGILSIMSLCLLSACGGLSNFQSRDAGPLPPASAKPADLAYGWHPGIIGDAASMYGSPARTRAKIAAVLPLTGKYAAAGTSMQRAMEIAALKAGDSISIEFFDIGVADKKAAMDDAADSGADIILGPLFADDVAVMRERNGRIPVIAFSSDSDALGGGVVSLGVAPKQQAERIVRYAAAMSKRNMLIIAPDTKSGRILAANSRAAAEMYGVEIVGLYYHDENERPDSLRELAKKLAYHKARSEANTEAKGILSEVLNQGGLSAEERADLTEQLKTRTGSDTLGNLPYDSVLILSNANDSKSMASFLRYYDVAAGAVQFFGTAAWDADSVRSDMILAGAAFPGLPMNSPDFISSYRALDGKDPSRAAGAGYDAVMIAAKIIRGDVPAKIALGDSAGWRGVDGIVRFRANGESERGLAIYRLTGTSRMSVSDLPPENFMKQLYKLGPVSVALGNRIDLPSLEIEPMDYINIPARFAGKHRKARAASGDYSPAVKEQRVFYVDDAPSESFVDDAFKFEASEKVEQKLLENVRITERVKTAPKPAAKKPAAPKQAAAAPAPKPAPKPGTKTKPLPPADYMDVEPF